MNIALNTIEREREREKDMNWMMPRKIKRERGKCMMLEKIHEF